MRKFLIPLVSAGLVLGLSVAPAAAAAPGEPAMVMVMKHQCDESIQSEADFEALEAKAATNPETPMDVPSLGATAETVLACPVVVQPGDGQTPDAVGGGEQSFDFSVQADGTSWTLTQDATFSGDNGFDTPVEDFACESDIGYDADRSGTIDEDVCLDFSSYSFADVPEGQVTVTETSAPDGTRFGTVRLTPPELSDDAAIGLSFDATGRISFDSSADGDEMVMLHVYNFVGEKMPDAAMSAPATGVTLPLTLLGLGSLLAAGGTALAVRRVRS